MTQVGISPAMGEVLDRPTHGGNLDWAARGANCSPSEILDFSASINPLGPPRKAIAAIQSHIPSIRAYPDPSYYDFRQVLAHHHQAHHQPIDPDWICPGNGSAELLTWASRELCSYDATALISPAFGDYGRSLRAFGGRIATCLMMPERGSKGAGERGSRGAEKQGSGLVEVLDAGLKNWDGQLGIIINNPHNPTGQMWQRDEILSLMDRFALVVVDEAFMDFLRPGQQQSVVDDVVNYKHLVVLRSLTKFYSMPGLRIGYAVTHPDRIRQWQQWRDPWPVNTLAIAAAAASLADVDFQRQTLDWLDNARPRLFEGLQQIPRLSPCSSVANYLLVHTEQSAVAWQRQLLERDRILIRDCVSFPELGDRYFRLAVRTVEENQRLLAALRDINF
ncbi:MAG: threonine-phosphate decarboxylase CobD [Cyanobacteria bacterium P01_F01_bin.150]